MQDSSFRIIQPGIEHNWLPLGKTTIFGEYRHGNTANASINFWQGGVVQKIEAADMYLYLLYQHADGDVTGNAATSKANAAPNGVTPLDGFRKFIAGVRINF